MESFTIRELLERSVENKGMYLILKKRRSDRVETLMFCKIDYWENINNDILNSSVIGIMFDDGSNAVTVICS